MPRLEMVSASQPLERQPSAGALRTRTLTSHHLKHATFGTLNGDLALTWLNRLSDLFQLPAPSMPAPVAISESSTHLSLEDCALGYMPPAAPATPSLNSAAFVAFAHGLHTYTIGSARHVDVTAVHVAVGRVRSGGLAPWACTPPPTGWTVQTCAALGLDLVASEDAASVVLDAAAPVDSDAADVACAQAPAVAVAAPPGPQLAALEHRGIGGIGGTGGAGTAPTALDPLLAHVQQRRAAEEQRPAASAVSAPEVQPLCSVRPAARAPAAGPQHHAPVPAQPAAAVGACGRPSVGPGPAGGGTSRPPAAQRSNSGSSDGMQVSGASPADSDVEVLSGRDACMMAVTRLQLQRLSIMLTPDSCALVQRLAEQVAASVAMAGGPVGAARATRDVAGGAPDGSPDHCAGERSSMADSRSCDGRPGDPELDAAPATAFGEVVPAAGPAADNASDTVGYAAVGSISEPPSTGAPAWPEEPSERRSHDGSGSTEVSMHDVHALEASLCHSERAGAADAPPSRVCSGLAGSQGSRVWSQPSGAESQHSSGDPVVHDEALSNMFEEGPSSADGHSVGVSPRTTDDSCGTPCHDTPASAQALSQTLFVDASSTLITSAALPRGDLPGSPVDVECGARAAGGSPLRPADPALLPQHASPENIMHDMMLPGGSVVAVGMCEGRRSVGQGLSSAGIPTEQEADGVILPEFQGSTDGLLSASIDNYVGADEPAPPPRLHEPVIGPLGEQYPDSCRRISLASQSITVLLRSDGVSMTDLGMATRMRGGGLVRLQVSAVRVQHDLFPEGAPRHMRVAVAARAVTAQQAGFSARSRGTVGKDGGVQWRPLAVQLQHGPSDPRRDVLRLLLRVNDTEHGTREASAWLRLPSLRLHLEQPCLLFLRVCFCVPPS